MNDIHPVALFRYSVLGPLVSRAELRRGELKAIHPRVGRPPLRHTRLAQQPHRARRRSKAWYYAWRRGGIGALTPKAALGPGAIEDRPRGPGGHPRGQTREPAPLHPGDSPCARTPWYGGQEMNCRVRRSTACCKPMACRARAVRRANPRSGARMWRSTPAISGTGM